MQRGRHLRNCLGTSKEQANKEGSDCKEGEREDKDEMEKNDEGEEEEGSLKEEAKTRRGIPAPLLAAATAPPATSHQPPWNRGRTLSPKGHNGPEDA